MRESPSSESPVETHQSRASRPSSALAPRERLRQVELDDLLSRLLSVAEGLHWYVLRSYRGAPEPLDLVQQAVADVLDGTRCWPSHVDAFTMLCGVMRSRVSNFAARQRPLGRSRLEPQTGEGGRYVYFDDHPADPTIILRSSNAPDNILLNEELRDRIRQLVAGDDELERIVELLFDDPYYGAADLAEQLETSVNGIYNARKRLRRRLDSLRP
ncbi:hypothetical protein BSZ35_18620 [Salinibacter sp. 10B]|uniref:sigma-70 family RNA polymerase sigma factor n=1 Tax=Salinibacter sp. 10B TaxID=1923971 RepID=UPI000CF49432|nr:sigma-70 family RNA polymerase sigma factor [Salinibacter sp. 10B]PQJ26939.1 hypothetical protein BSZ35_18620 [Salinibacter sp. 10B]